MEAGGVLAVTKELGAAAQNEGRGKVALRRSLSGCRYPAGETESSNVPVTVGFCPDGETDIMALSERAGPGSIPGRGTGGPGIR